MQEELQSVGLSQDEAKIYLALCEIGTASAYKIAKKAGIHRGYTYEVMERLIEKGYVQRKQVDLKTLYEAADPNVFLQQLDAQREKLNELIPKIRLQQQSVVKESVFREYKGADALVQLLTGFLKFNEPILVWGVPKTAYSFLKHRIERFHVERMRRRIVMKHIYNSTAYERIATLKKMPFTPIRILPGLYDSDVASNVCGDEVVFALFKAPMKIWMIKDLDMANAYKNYFRILWNDAKKA